ncbi:MFS transporter [Clostridium formicaceticum]|uniref:Inner membrane protein YqcE n=1 Tax=Clostridium formicaceticum TaxID=1497 RepID=A0AAC9RRR2_9CLOT|nr:MFS transporter [Clostridium formicaceticum]AOY75311.1 hypothetical protein BJL90_04970 [Clostridium formicaceticum]ARE89755.1 Inner membrane protein YqcE [Clostridium formicaceticum]
MEKSKGKTGIIFLILSFCAGMAYFTPLLKFTFYDQMMSALSLDDIQINMLSSVYALVNTLVYPVSGVLGDKFSAKKLIAISMFGLAVFTVFYALTTDYVTLIIIHAFFGIFAVGTFWAAYIKSIRNLGPEKDQGKLFGMSEGTRGIGQAVVGFIAVWIIGMCTGISQGFKAMLLFTAVVYALLGILVLFFVPDTKAEVKEKAAGKKENSFITAFKIPGTWIAILLLMSGFSLWLLANTYLTTYSVRVLGISQQTASTLGIIRSYIIVLAAGFVGGWLMDKFTYRGKVFFVVFGLCIMTIAGIMGTSQLVTLSIALTIVLTLITNIIKSTYWSILGQAGIPPEMTAMCTGVISFVAFIPEAIITVICGSWLKSAEAAGNIGSGFTKIFTFMVMWAVLGLIAGILLTRRTKKLKTADMLEEKNECTEIS